MEVIAFFAALCALGISISLAIYTFWNARRKKEDFILERRAYQDQIDTMSTELAEYREKNKKLYRIKIASFGKPELKIYNPAEFDGPLQCTSCEELLTVGEDYYEIPISNEAPGTVTAVHLRCERAVKFGS